MPFSKGGPSQSCSRVSDYLILTRIRVQESRWVVGNVSVPDAELSAVSTGILQALLLEDVNEIDVLTDSSTAIERILDC